MVEMTAWTPHDLTYYLDNALESGHITAGAHMICMLYGKTSAMDRIIETIRDGGTHWVRLAAKGAELERYAVSISKELPGDIALAMRSSSTLSALRKIEEYIEFAATSAFEDAVWGGAMIPPHSRGTQGTGISKKIGRRLFSAKWIDKRTIAHMSDVDLKSRVNVWRISGASFAVNFSSMERVNDLFLEQQGRRRAEIDRFITDHSESVEWKDGKHKPMKKPKNRRSTVRAAMLAAGVLGSSAVTAFASGETVNIAAGDITIQAKRSRSVSSSGHGALTIGIVDRCGKHLSNLCVYQELPALDQLASLGLHAAAGQIASVIEAGNLYNTAPAAWNHPALSSKHKPSSSNIEALGLWAADHNQKRAFAEAYYATSKDIWVDRFFVHLFGRRSREAIAALREIEGYGTNG